MSFLFFPFNPLFTGTSIYPSCFLTKDISKLDGLQYIWRQTAIIGSKRTFPTSVPDRWHNSLLIYWHTTCL